MEHENLYASKGADLLFDNGIDLFQSKLFNSVDRISYEDKDVIIATAQITSEEIADFYISFEGHITVLEEARNYEDGLDNIKKSSFYNMRCVFDRVEQDCQMVTTYTFVFANGDTDVDRIMDTYYNKKKEIEALDSISSNVHHLSLELARIDNSIEKTNQRIDMFEKYFGVFLDVTTNAMSKATEIMANKLEKENNKNN